MIGNHSLVYWECFRMFWGDLSRIWQRNLNWNKTDENVNFVWWSSLVSIFVTITWSWKAHDIPNKMMPLILCQIFKSKLIHVKNIVFQLQSNTVFGDFIFCFFNIDNKLLSGLLFYRPKLIDQGKKGIWITCYVILKMVTWKLEKSLVLWVLLLIWQKQITTNPIVFFDKNISNMKASNKFLIWPM